MAKYIFALISMLVVSVIVILPFNLILVGFYNFYMGLHITGLVKIIIGLIYLRLVKPISIITGKNYKVF